VFAHLLLFEKVIDLHREPLLLVIHLLELEEQIVDDLPCRHSQMSVIDNGDDTCLSYPFR
jgi:hypothetical protein